MNIDKLLLDEKENLLTSAEETKRPSVSSVEQGSIQIVKASGNYKPYNARDFKAID